MAEISNIPQSVQAPASQPVPEPIPVKKGNKKSWIIVIIVIVFLIICGGVFAYWQYYLQSQSRKEIKPSIIPAPAVLISPSPVSSPSANPIASSSASPKPAADLPVDFNEAGNLIASSGAGEFALLYEEPGKPALPVRLLFDYQDTISQCIIAGQTMPCQQALDNGLFIVGDIVTIEGLETEKISQVEKQVAVIKLTK